MSAQAETEPHETIPLLRSSEFDAILTGISEEGYPGFLGWSKELSADTFGYLVKAPGTRRVVAVIERSGKTDSEWLAQTFRVRDDDSEEAFEEVCRQMMEETSSYYANPDYVVDMMRKLYLGYQMRLEYASVILECNDPSGATSKSDDSSTVFCSVESENQKLILTEDTVNIADVVRDAFEDDSSDLATLAVDIGTHMGDLSQQIILDEDIITVYRTRLHNYPWASGPDGPLVDDLVMIKVNDGSVWYVGAINFDREVSRQNVNSFRDYSKQLIDLDVPSVVIEGITSRIKETRGEKPPSFLMAELLEKEKAEVAEFEQEAETSNPYDLLDEVV